MDRADRELVDAVAVDLERNELARRDRGTLVGRNVLAEWVVAPRPVLVEHEAPAVRMPLWRHAKESADLALVPVSGRDAACEGRVDGSIEGKVNAQPDVPRRRRECDLDGQALPADRSLVQSDEHHVAGARRHRGTNPTLQGLGCHALDRVIGNRLPGTDLAGDRSAAGKLISHRCPQGPAPRD